MIFAVFKAWLVCRPYTVLWADKFFTSIYNLGAVADGGEPIRSKGQGLWNDLTTNFKFDVQIDYKEYFRKMRN